MMPTSTDNSETGQTPQVPVRGLEHLQHAEELLVKAEGARQARDHQSAGSFVDQARVHTEIAKVWLDALDRFRTTSNDTLTCTLMQARRTWACAAVDVDPVDLADGQAR
ncbi:hypothetical protein [Nonomuraea endophytica]|uniref:hypothetical protein n=1 Tax=Nonomuraea endophytica TaxID=714136 RepID=UPI0037C5854A